MLTRATDSGTRCDTLVVARMLVLPHDEGYGTVGRLELRPDSLAVYYCHATDQWGDRTYMERVWRDLACTVEAFPHLRKIAVLFHKSGEDFLDAQLDLLRQISAAAQRKGIQVSVLVLPHSRKPTEQLLRGSNGFSTLPISDLKEFLQPWLQPTV